MPQFPRGSIIQKPVVETFTGKEFNLMEPTFESIDILDIAHGLSNVCRYMGQVKKFYSVAQHSIIMAKHATPQNTLACLLHDGAEAYTSDIPSPLKDLVPGLYDIEEKITGMIHAKFYVRFTDYAEIKRLDFVLMATEVRDLMPNKIWGNFPLGPLPEIIVPMTSKQAEKEFLSMFHKYAHCLVQGLVQGCRRG